MKKIKSWNDFEESKDDIEEIEDIFIDFKDIGFEVKIIKPDKEYYDKFGVYKCSLRIFGWVSTEDVFEKASEISIKLKEDITRMKNLVENIEVRRYDISNMKLNDHGQILPSRGLDVKISINFDIV
jgi:uncharacterized protein (UPF0335 family)